jgi:UrcA family protein
MTYRIIRSTACAWIGAALVISAAPAFAGSTENFTTEVRYGDLNLTTDAGVAQLQRRIKAAAAAACGRPDGRDIKASQAAATCRETAVANAKAKVELAVANARSGQDLAANSSVKVGTPVTR